jgi:NAD(P)-dependent dehydrogenase (short-subunit alcohol dehydrogenase family)
MQTIMDVNCWGLINVLQVMAGVARLPGRIVVVGSDAAWRPMRTSLAYCASKAALHMAVKVLAREYSDSFRINCVAPGMTHGTGMQRYVDERVPEVRGWTLEQTMEYEIQQEVTPGRVHVKEVAEVVRWLALDAPPSVHGEIITVNGGRS